MKWFLMSGAALVLGVTMSGAVLAKGNSGTKSQSHNSSHCEPSYHEPCHQSYCPPSYTPPAPVYQQPVAHESEEVCFREDEHPEWACRWWSDKYHCWFFWAPAMKSWFYWCNNCHKFYPMSAMEHMPPTGHEPGGYESLPRMGPDGKVEALPFKHDDDGPPGKAGPEGFKPDKDMHKEGDGKHADDDRGFKPGDGKHKDGDDKHGPVDFKQGKVTPKDSESLPPATLGKDGSKAGDGKHKDADDKHGPVDSKQGKVMPKDSEGLPPSMPGADDGPTAVVKGPQSVAPGVSK
jgi:hypothetical protein